MGKRNSRYQQEETLRWAETYRYKLEKIDKDFSLAILNTIFSLPLKNYFSLSGLSRSKTAPLELVELANKKVFQVRVAIENSIVDSIKNINNQDLKLWDGLFQGSFYGCSKKQGVSLRIGLNSCQPTNLCKAPCYAHDVLDAAPTAVIRGAVNYFLAETYEDHLNFREEIMIKLLPHTKKAVRSAITEVKNLPKDWTRGARIRFSHVGEMVAFPQFTNSLGKQVREVSNGTVENVIYTRHPNAGKLDPDLFVVNFTLDESSEQRKQWVPRGARVVFSAFGGRVSQEAEINFLEHHRWKHFSPVGDGSICPTTLPEQSDRTCDGVRCDRCFVS